MPLCEQMDGKPRAHIVAIALVHNIIIRDRSFPHSAIPASECHATTPAWDPGIRRPAAQKASNHERTEHANGRPFHHALVVYFRIIVPVGGMGSPRPG